MRYLRWVVGGKVRMAVVGTSPVGVAAISLGLNVAASGLKDEDFRCANIESGIAIQCCQDVVVLRLG